MASCYALIVRRYYWDADNGDKEVVACEGCYLSFRGARTGLAAAAMEVVHQVHGNLGDGPAEAAHDLAVVRRCATVRMPCGPVPHRRHAEEAWALAKKLLSDWDHEQREASIEKIGLYS